LHIFFFTTMSDNMDTDHNDIKNDPEIAQLIEYLKAKKIAATASKSPPEIIPSIRNFNRPINHIRHFKRIRHPHTRNFGNFRHKETFRFPSGGTYRDHAAKKKENKTAYRKKSKITDKDVSVPTKIVYKDANGVNQFF
jgi:hypothetical protein